MLGRAVLAMEVSSAAMPTAMTMVATAQTRRAGARPSRGIAVLLMAPISDHRRAPSRGRLIAET
ncbi:MAG: hypothetical protein WDN49_20295 [Acetobacteraceae bacterium]